MRKLIDRRSIVVVGGLMTGLLVFAGIASGTIGRSADRPNVYWACVPTTGTVHLIDPGGSCKNGQRLIKWNQKGMAGETGATGPAGTGVAGPTGAKGDAGAAGDSAFAYYYNTLSSTVPADGDVVFDSSSETSPGFSHAPGTADVTVLAAGVYKASFSISSRNFTQFAVFLNGTAVPGSTYGSYPDEGLSSMSAHTQQSAGTQRGNPGTVILTAHAGDLLSLRNQGGDDVPLSGRPSTVNASLLLEQLGSLPSADEQSHALSRYPARPSARIAHR